MFEWIVQNISTIVIGAVLLAVVGIIVFSMVRNKKKGKSSCGCGCSTCTASKKCHNK